MIKKNNPEAILSISTGRILGIDYGTKRIGLALSDPFQMLAATLKTVLNKDAAGAISEIEKLIKENNVQAIIAGHPLHMTGDESEMAAHVIKFLQKLDDRINMPIFMWDERWTTVSAEKLLIETGRSPSQSRHKIDQLAAAYLLQSFLDRMSYLKRNI